MRFKAIFLIAILVMLSACSVKYTNFAYEMRGCSEDDAGNITKVSGNSVLIQRTLNFSKVGFEKNQSVMKIYYRNESSCKFFNIEISNLTKGDYVLETYFIKYEDVSFFELVKTENMTIK